MQTGAIDTLKAYGGKEIKVYDSSYDNSQIDQEGFLKVLLASFQFQDPFEAQDISKFIDNTVKLRELEVMKNFEDSVNKLSGTDALFLNATNMIGKKVSYEGDMTYVEDGKSEVSFSLPKDATDATVYIYDDENNIVDSATFHNLQANKSYKFALENEDIKDGYYKVSVVAHDGSQNIHAKVVSTALIEGIEKDSANILAKFAKGSIELNKIITIGV
ncbi:flagellar hook assembly protein FlgD [Nitratiruptor sp. YY09-18]|uniref:flagellar hook assembly protein FlgD n=1 Tax=Nitratiruptor sp. YY09-18 TaxID=2724901 RepID=UPI00191551CA|nr:flagellar hook capping FlgD N-terminal domain-containing protein [Nitratiruptor sp. YY09-18]BCD68383.1 flagellar basal-body rod modification protein FlgD [Nitratiruptor sp. YY09-18]